MPLGDHASHWSNLLGEIVREFPMHYPSWHKIEAERKAGVLGKISTQFDLMPHMQSDLWPKIKKGLEQHLAKNQEGHQATFGQDLHRQQVGVEGRALDWDAQLAFWLDPKNVSRCAPNARNREEMLRLQGLGPNTPTGVPYTDDEIMAIVRRGKQRGNLPGLGRVLAGQGKDVLEPRFTHTADVDELKRTTRSSRNRWT
ncbi:hypothetical protein Tco_0676460 [Tanacetum coccineum]